MKYDLKETLFYLFPFGFILDKNGNIMDCAKSFHKLFPSTFLGKHNSELFSNFIANEINSQTDINKIFILQSPLINLRLRGQLINLEENYFFAGSISATDMNEFAKHKLTFSDFSLQDPIFDFMMTIASERHSSKKLYASLSALEYKNYLNSMLLEFSMDSNLSQTAEEVLNILYSILFKIFKFKHLNSLKLQNDSSDNFKIFCSEKYKFVNSKLEKSNESFITLEKAKALSVINKNIIQEEQNIICKISILNIQHIIIFEIPDISQNHDSIFNFLEVLIQLCKIKLENIIANQEKYQLVQQQAHLGRMNLLGEMSAGIAHEINSPLTVVKSKTNKLKKLIQESKIETANEADTDLILKSVERIIKVIKGLRNFARDGSADPLEPSLIYKIIDDSLILCETRIKNNDIQIQVKIEPPDIQINCRSIEISQIITNLINNSMDAMENVSLKAIHIHCFEDETNFYMEVKDTGPEISAEIRKKIMSPFFTTKEPGKGTGLGLSISFSIAREHGGELYLKDTSDTCFVLKLPRHII